MPNQKEEINPVAVFQLILIVILLLIFGCLWVAKKSGAFQCNPVNVVERKCETFKCTEFQKSFETQALFCVKYQIVESPCRICVE